MKKHGSMDQFPPKAPKSSGFAFVLVKDGSFLFFDVFGSYASGEALSTTIAGAKLFLTKEQAQEWAKPYGPSVKVMKINFELEDLELSK